MKTFILSVAVVLASFSASAATCGLSEVDSQTCLNHIDRLSATIGTFAKFSPIEENVANPSDFFTSGYVFCQEWLISEANEFTESSEETMQTLPLVYVTEIQSVVKENQQITQGVVPAVAALDFGYINKSVKKIKLPAKAFKI